MLREYKNVITRILSKEERTFSSSQDSLPLVIEATHDKSSGFLFDFLRANHLEIKDDVETYGAILLRGFDLRTDEDFERAILEIKGFEPIKDYFMKEEGRDQVSGTSLVLHTNTIVNTGGGAQIPRFHTENYFTPDVPHYICFFCRTPSKMGGETGITNLAKTYEELNPALQAKLEESTFFVCRWPISEVLEAYDIPKEKVEEVCDVCQQFGLTIVGSGEDRFVILNKPTVLVDPSTKMKSLQAQFDLIPGIFGQITKRFLRDFPGKQWFFLRVLWRLPISPFIVPLMKLFFHDRKIIYKMRKRYSDAGKIMLKHIFSKRDVAELASGMRKNFSGFKWKSGDILLIDNSKIAHTGMPGDRSPRVIRAMICNPLKMEYSFPGSGAQVLKDSMSPSLGEVLASYRYK